jgi:hypothetical protein
VYLQTWEVNSKVGGDRVTLTYAELLERQLPTHREATVPKPRDHTPDCGTTAAYQRHIRYGETPDPACTQAAAAYQRHRYARKGKTPDFIATKIRQALARGDAVSEIMARHAVTYATVKAIRDRDTEAA